MNNTNPLVSVIMNCNNGEKYLDQSLKSLKNQTYENWELIFFDNNSTDTSLSILKKENDHRIKIFTIKKLSNLYRARNLAIEKAKGKYLSFLDVDDLWEQDKLKTQVDFLERNNNYKFSYSNYFVKQESDNRKFLRFKKNLKSGNITQDLLNNYSIGILTVLLEKEFFKEFLFEDRYNIIGDFDLFLKISRYHQIAYIDKPLATYRVHNNNYSSVNLEKYISEYNHWFESNENKYKNDNYSLFFQRFYLIKLKIKLFFKKLGV
jgi:glycosyltransferase involved in cell wall biosynthesis